MKEILLKVTGLKKYFPITKGVFRKHVGDVKAVDNVDFTLYSGEILGIVGESGSGKSTTGRAAIRLIEPTEGQISFLGHDLMALDKNQLRKIRKDAQMVFQDPYSSLNPRHAIGDSIAEGLWYHGLVSSNSEARSYVADVMRRVGLSPDWMNRYPHQFSGGQQQRICIGRAIAMNPRLIICDEAASALDVSVQAQILNLLIELKENSGFSYLFISHDLSVVRHICDYVLVMHHGRVVEHGPVGAIFEDPQDAYTKKLLAAIPSKMPHR
jgi:ABC-type oligopeptide transport system ATPase subunit